MEKEEVIKLNVPVTVPENLKYNKKGSFSSVVTCDYQGNTESNTSNIVLATKTGMAESSEERTVTNETKTGLNTQISATVGNDSLSENDNIYEGETIKYKVTITNNTGKDYTNVSVKAVQKNGYVWDWCEEERINYYEGTEKIKENFYKLTNTNSINCGKIENLKNGESYTYEYEASAFHLDDENIDGNKTYGTISITSEDGELNDSAKTVENNIVKAKYDIKLEQNYANEVKCTSESSVSVNLKINNISGSKQENLRLKIAFSNNLNLGNDDSEILDNIFLIRNDMEDRVSMVEKKSGENGKTILTLNISRIEANETFEMDVVPYTSSIQGTQDNVEMIAQIEEDSGDIYVSNSSIRTIYSNSNNITVSQKILKNGTDEIKYDSDVIQDGETLQIVGNITNNKSSDTKCNISYKFDSSLEIQSAILNNGSDIDITGETEGNGYLTSGTEIKSKSSITITITAKVNSKFGESKNALNVLSVTDNATYDSYTFKQQFLINKNEGTLNNSDEDNNDNDNDASNGNEDEDRTDSDEDETIVDGGDNSSDENNNDNKNDNDNNNDGNNSSNDDSNSSNDNITNDGNYQIKGTVWVDENSDGKMSSDEQKLSEIKVGAISSETGTVIATTSTDSNGEYSLDLKEGKYIIIFYYDTNVYSVTTYQVKGTTNDINSSAINKKINIDGEDIDVGATDYIDVKSSIDNINLGLVKKNKFDVNISKTVSKISISNSLGNTVKEYKDSTLAKAEIKAKYLKGSTVAVEYKIKVTNQGNVAGYVKDIVDNKAKDLQFNSSINKEWYQSGDTLHTTSLSNTKLEPGESKELTLVLTKTMTESNTGLVNNTAQVASSSGENGAESKTNGKASANVIISVSTGALVSYVTITIIILTSLGLCAYILNRKIFKE